MYIDYSDLYNSKVIDICDKLLKLFKRHDDVEIRRCINTRNITVSNDMIKIGGSDPCSWDGGYFYLEITNSNIKYRWNDGFGSDKITTLYSYDSDGKVLEK